MYDTLILLGACFWGLYMRIRAVFPSALFAIALVSSAAASAQVAQQIITPGGGRQLHVFNNQPFPLRCNILEWNGVATQWVEGVVPPGVTIWKWVHPANPVQWQCVPA